MTQLEIRIIERFLEAPFGTPEMYDALADLIGLCDARRLQYAGGSRGGDYPSG